MLFKRGELAQYRPVFGGSGPTGKPGSDAGAAGAGAGPKLKILGVDMANLYLARYLAALYAALLHSQGGSALFVMTPGHIFVAADTGVSMKRAKARLGLDPKGLIERYGTAWVPVEVTQVGASFMDAVQAGMTEVARYRAHEAYEEVEISKAWRRFPPFVGLASKGGVMADASVLQARVNKTAKALQAAEAAAGADSGKLPPPSQVKTPAGLNTIGVRLAERGRLEDARRYFRQGAKVGGANAVIRYNLANMHVVGKRYDQAELAFRRLASDKALKSRVWHGLAVVSYMRGQAKAAKKLFSKARLPESKRLIAQLGLSKKRKKPKARRKAKAPRKAKPGAMPKLDPKFKPGAKKKSKLKDIHGGRFIGVRASSGVTVDTMLLWVR